MCTDIDHSREITAQLKSGNKDAFEIIFKDCWADVYRAALKRVRDEDIAKEITQELFIELWEKKDTVEIRGGSVLAYLLGSVKYRVINYFKSAITRQRYHDDLSLLMGEASFDHIESTYNQHEIHSALKSTMAKMPERMRLVFTMSRLDQKSISEIANELNLSGQTVKNQLSAAMKLVRKHFSLPLLFILLIFS
jgi:RNA polymerase sigma-70 factor (ECF subfamily)